MTRTPTTMKQENPSCAAAMQLDKMTRLFFEYEFTSMELSRRPFELTLLNELHEQGIIEAEEQLKLTLVLQEALTNSLEHGNLELDSHWKNEINKDGIDRYSREKIERLADARFANRRIQLSVEYKPKELTIKILDEGKGFDMDGITRAEPGEAILCYGRGMTIIDQVMDTVEYAQGGRLLEMRRTLSGNAVEQ